MTSYNFAFVGLRLMGIYFFSKAIEALGTTTIWITLMGQVQPSGLGFHLINLLVFVALPCVVYVIVAFLLFYKASSWAARLAPASHDDPAGSVFSLEDLQATAFAMTGLVILTMAVPNIGRAWQEMALWWASPPSKENVSINVSLSHAVGILLQLILGLVLLTNARAFRNVWHWLRTAGT